MNIIPHNLKVALRNLMKYKLQTAISVLSIAVGIVTLALTHSVLTRFLLPAIYSQPYFDRTYDMQFFSSEEGRNVKISSEIINAVKRDGGPKSAEKLAVPNGYRQNFYAEFHLADSTVRKGEIRMQPLDPEYAAYAGLRSAVKGSKIRSLKVGEAIIGEDFARKVFGDSNPIGAVQISTNKAQPIPVRIVDVYKSLSITDKPMDERTLYYCIADDVADYDFDDYYASVIGVVIRDGFTKTQLEQEINFRVKPLGLTVRLNKKSEDPQIKMILSVQAIGYMIGALILLAAIIGFLRMEIQLFRMRRRELNLRIVNGASRSSLFGMLFTEISIPILLSIIIAMILGVLLQDFWNSNFDLFIDNTGIKFKDLWRFCLSVGGGLLIICSVIVWIALSGINIRKNDLAGDMRKSHSHTFRNVMLGVQTLICLIFVCCTFILADGGNKILKVCNVPDNDDRFKECLYLYPDDAKDKKLLIDEIKRLPDLEKAIICDARTWSTAMEIKNNPDVKEKLNGTYGTYFKTYQTDDTTLLSALGMDVDWFALDIDRSDCILLSEGLYAKLKEIGLLDSNTLTMDIDNGDRPLPIAGTIRNIAYDSEGKSIVVIQPNITDKITDYLLIPKPGKGRSLEKSVEETAKTLEPEIINSVVSNYRQRVSELSDFMEAAKAGGWILGCVSLLICTMSIYSSIALDTRGRRKEIAVRKVNGAKSRDIYRLFGKVYVVIIAASLLIAIPVCVLFSSTFETMFQEIDQSLSFSPICPIALGCTLVIILITAIVTLQIRRVMQTDPARTIAKE